MIDAVTDVQQEHLSIKLLLLGHLVFVIGSFGFSGLDHLASRDHIEAQGPGPARLRRAGP